MHHVGCRAALNHIGFRAKALNLTWFRAHSLPAGRSNRHSAFEYQLSTNAFNFLARLGCLNFRNAFASICRILSRVTSKSCPTSSRV